MYKTIFLKYRLLLLILLVPFIITFILFILYPKGIFYNGITTPMKSNYTMKVNKIEKIGNTTISLDEVLLDVNKVYLKSHVFGADKLIALEARKDLKDKFPLYTFTDLWIGGKFKFLKSSKGYFVLPLKGSKISSTSKTEDTVISPLYLTFYFSNGKNKSFKIEDTNNVGNVVKILDINKTLNFNTSKKDTLYLKFGRFIKGISYTSLNINTNFYPKDIKITLLTDEGEFKPTGEGYGGGVIGKIYFHPIIGNTIKIKVKNKKTNEEKLIPLEMN